MLAGLPPQSHQGLHVPDNEKRSCPGAENWDPAVSDVRQAGVSAEETELDTQK